MAAIQAAKPDLPGLVRELESQDFVKREAAAEGLAAAGSAGARAALAGFETAVPRARALRAHVIRLGADGALLDEVLALCADPSPAVRAEFAAYLGSALRDHPPPTRVQIERACAELEQFAASDSEGAVRTAALESLSRADLEEASRALSRLTSALTGTEAALAAQAFANSPRSGGLLLELVQSNFEGKGPRLEESALAVLFAEGYGAALAEAERGGLDARGRLPFAMGGRATSPAVRAASQLGFQGFLGRARFLGAIARAEDVCAALASEVADPSRVLLASAVFTLTAGSDPTRALTALQRLKALIGPPRAEARRARRPDRGRWATGSGP